VHQLKLRAMIVKGGEIGVQLMIGTQTYRGGVDNRTAEFSLRGGGGREKNE